ncbi:unnamed protein product [Eruca vesicaria subsp. sativa]|uniref:Uncharacterized protein n=1 Tax=Eruca vesicaria subsp. sativa TaxID=29727 RepID=A0ABC8KRD7_ERUVS|nr:unnamed protein product [Eruca vesicaria subsp. sativa]
MNMEGAKRTPLSARKKPMRKSRRLVKSIVAYLKSDSYLYAPLFSDFSPQIKTPSPSDSVSPLADRLDFEAGKLQVTNLVTREVSTSSTTMRDDNNNYRNLRSDIAEHVLRNGRINSPKRSLVILDGQQTGLSS